MESKTLPGGLGVKRATDWCGVLVGRKKTPGPDREWTPADAPTVPVNEPCQPTMDAAAGQSRAPPKCPTRTPRRPSCGEARRPPHRENRAISPLARWYHREGIVQPRRPRRGSLTATPLAGVARHVTSQCRAFRFWAPPPVTELSDWPRCSLKTTVPGDAHCAHCALDGHTLGSLVILDTPGPRPQSLFFVRLFPCRSDLQG
jgi:hypothetical protein